MKMIILIFIISSYVHAQSAELCDEYGNPIVTVISAIGIPNCLNSENSRKAKKLNDQSGLCGKCKSDFQIKSGLNIDSISPSEKKELFVKMALETYKKVISDNLIETVKLRALQPTGSKFSNSLSACKMKSLSEITKGCSSETKRLVEESGLLQNLNQQVANELARFMSNEPTFRPENTLLKRDPNICFISEKDLLMISSRAAEEALSPDMIETLIALDPEDYAGTNHMLLSIEDKYGGDIATLHQNLASHPLMAKYMDDPSKFIEFLKSIPSPRSTENLRAALYQKSNGDAFDEELALSCQQSFEAINKNLCSEDFQNGKFNLDPFSNYNHLKGTELPSFASDLADEDYIINANAEALKYCEENPELNKMRLSSIQSSMNDSLPSSYRRFTFSQFQEQKHLKEIGHLNDRVCKSANQPCTQDTFECKVLQKYNDLKNSGSLESKLARSSNVDVNSVLRSMIGDTSKLDPKTKEILIANGIIPKDDGTIVEQPDIPEREPEFYARENSVQNVGPARTNVVQNVAQNSGSQRIDRTHASFNENYSNVSNDSSSNQQNFADFSDILNDSSDELKNIQDEIRRRLSDLPESSQNNQRETRKVVRESFRKKGRTLTPAQENAITNRILNNSATTRPAQFAESLNDETNDAAVSDTETEIERWRNGQRDAALMGMAGAQQIAARNGGRSPASAEAPKELTKIALNLPEDPKIKLSDIFFNKLNTNDSETQLLKIMMKNQSNFLLQINSLNFRVIFNQNNTFNLLLEDGNSKDAERIRPQLEMFLRRLKS